MIPFSDGDNLTAHAFSMPFARKKELPIGFVSVWEVLGRVAIILGQRGAVRAHLLESARVFVDRFCKGDNSTAPSFLRNSRAKRTFRSTF